MKALIIGAAGFVGKHLLAHLAGGLHMEVTATKLIHERLDGQGARVADLDILDASATEKLIEEEAPGCVFHLAAQSSVAQSWKNPALTVDINIKGALNVLEAVRALKRPCRLLLIGSGEEYGAVLESELPVREGNALRPGNIYAVTKAAQNMLGTLYAKAYRMDVVCVRAFNHIGPGQGPGFAVADFCRQIALIEEKRQEPVILVGNLAAQRDFTDVRDVVRAYGLLALKGQSGQTYNVGSGHATALRTILDMLLSMAKTPIEVRVDPEKYRPADVPVMVADISKIAGDTGWSCAIPLESALFDTLAWWRTRAGEGGA